MTHPLFDSLARVHRYDDLEELLDFVCEAIVTSTGWNTAFITFYTVDGVQFGGAGVPPDTKARFRESYERTDTERRLEKRRQILEYVRPGTNVCFIPEGEGPRRATASVPGRESSGTWMPHDRLVVVMRDWEDDIHGTLSLDNPKSGDRPDDDAMREIRDIDHFVNVVARIAENRIWTLRLKESEEIYRGIFDATTDGIMIATPEARIVQANPAMCRLTGFTAEELRGRRAQELVHPKSRGDLKEAMRKSASSDDGPLIGTGLRKDGSSFDVEMQWIPFVHGEHRRILVVIHDATERNRVFRRLLEEQKEESITAVAGGVAHDFNNLLMGVTGPLSTLRASLPAGGDTARQIDRIASTADQLSRLTGQLLAIARGVHSEQRPVSLAGVLDESRGLLEGLMGSRFELEIESSDAETPVYGDRVQLGQVLLNLAQNARDAMQRGGRLRIATDVVTMENEFTCERTGVHPPGAYVRLRVTDDGRGIEREVARHVFEPYFSTKRGGSGLGLPAVLGIVRRHHGALRLESTQDAGTTVEILLPRCEAPIVEEGPPVVHGDAGAQAKRVLLVDDNDLVRDVASSLLDWLGCEVVSAASGREAIDIYQKRDRPFDLVLLDVSMPGLNGVETNEILQRVDPDVRVILTSGHAERLVRNESLGVRIAGFLEKPYTLERLRDALEAAQPNAGVTPSRP